MANKAEYHGSFSLWDILLRKRFEWPVGVKVFREGRPVSAMRNACDRTVSLLHKLGWLSRKEKTLTDARPACSEGNPTQISGRLSGGHVRRSLPNDRGFSISEHGSLSLGTAARVGTSTAVPRTNTNFYRLLP